MVYIIYYGQALIIENIIQYLLQIFFKRKSRMSDKKEIIEEIAKLMESDPNATPIEPTVLVFLSKEELISVLKNLYKSKETRSEQNEEWFQELCK